MTPFQDSSEGQTHSWDDGCVPPHDMGRKLIKRKPSKTTFRGLIKRKGAPIVAKKRPQRRLGASRRIPKSLLRRADDAFSLKVRERDKHCQYPGCTSRKIQCSHYEGRATKSTRFDFDNCISLCWWHHYKSKDLGFEYQKQRKEKHGYDGQYTLFMKLRLGTRRFNALIRRTKQKLKLTSEYLEDLIELLKA